MSAEDLCINSIILTTFLTFFIPFRWFSGYSPESSKWDEKTRERLLVWWNLCRHLSHTCVDDDVCVCEFSSSLCSVGWVRWDFHGVFAFLICPPNSRSPPIVAYFWSNSVVIEYKSAHYHAYTYGQSNATNGGLFVVTILSIKGYNCPESIYTHISPISVQMCSVATRTRHRELNDTINSTNTSITTIITQIWWCNFHNRAQEVPERTCHSGHEGDSKVVVRGCEKVNLACTSSHTTNKFDRYRYYRRPKTPQQVKIDCLWWWWFEVNSDDNSNKQCQTWKTKM